MMRCSKCLMPSSLPDSNFNQFGECSWCQSKFPNYAPRGAEELREVLEKNRTKSGSADCLIGLTVMKPNSKVLLGVNTFYVSDIQIKALIAQDSLKLDQVVSCRFNPSKVYVLSQL